MAFVSEWLTYAQDARAITDDDNVLGSNNYPDFREHRHDQAIMSLLVKKWNFYCLSRSISMGRVTQTTVSNYF